MNEEIDILLARYFSGEATEKELHTLDVWLSKSNENEKLFQEMTLLYQYAGQTDDLPHINTMKALAQFKTYIHDKQKNNSKVLFKVSNMWKVAATVAILIIGVFTVSYFINQSSKTVQLMAIGVQKEFTIFEDINVILFPGTEIIYNAKSKREIQLKGKATFRIDSKISGKIIVQAGETYIEDVGTIFTVDATTPDKSVTVEVTEGEVWFYTDINAGVYLKANESAIYDAQTKQFMMIVETSRATSLPEIIFQNTPFYEAINLIKAYYEVDIIISSNEFNEVLLNASFNNNESVEYVLEIITATISARLSKKNNIYIITSWY